MTSLQHTDSDSLSCPEKNNMYVTSLCITGLRLYNQVNLEKVKWIRLQGVRGAICKFSAATSAAVLGLQPGVCCAHMRA